MAEYAITSQTTLPSGLTSYDVILKADDGYQENQTYVGSSAQVLVDATKHFNDEHMAQVAAEQAALQAQPTQPTFVTVQ